MESFGKRLRHVRKQKRVKQRILAEELNIAISTLSQYENDKRHPNFDLLVRIANYFDVTTDFLLGLNEEDTTTNITKNIDLIDLNLNGKLTLSYNELLHKITKNLLVISENNDIKSLAILHELYDSISSIDIEYSNGYSPKVHLEEVLSTHLTHKEDIDQTLNKLFRHHIKICSEKAI